MEQTARRTLGRRPQKRCDRSALDHGSRQKVGRGPPSIRVALFDRGLIDHARRFRDDAGAEAEDAMSTGSCANREVSTRKHKV